MQQQHFIFFALEFEVLPRREMDPLEALVTPLIAEFNGDAPVAP
jgi:hypothetical protein